MLRALPPLLTNPQLCLLCRRCMWARKPCAQWTGFTSTALTAPVSKPSTKQESAPTARPWCCRHPRVRHSHSPSPVRPAAAHTHTWGTSPPQAWHCHTGNSTLAGSLVSEQPWQGDSTEGRRKGCVRSLERRPQCSLIPFPLQKVSSGEESWKVSQREVL